MVDPSKSYAQTSGEWLQTEADAKEMLIRIRELQKSMVRALAVGYKLSNSNNIRVYKRMLDQNIHGSALALELAQTELSANLTGHFGEATLKMMQRHKEELDKQAWFE